MLLKKKDIYVWPYGSFNIMVYNWYMLDFDSNLELNPKNYYFYL